MKLFLILAIISLALTQKRKTHKKQIIRYSAGDPVPVTTIYRRPERTEVHYPNYSYIETYTPTGHTHVVQGGSTPLVTPVMQPTPVSKRNKKNKRHH